MLYILWNINVSYFFVTNNFVMLNHQNYMNIPDFGNWQGRDAVSAKVDITENEIDELSLNSNSDYFHPLMNEYIRHKPAT